MVYDNTDNETIDEAVRWLIIVFIFVFDPLAVLLLIAANYSFQHRNDHKGRQEEIFDNAFSKKKVAKPLDIESEIRDNRPSEEIDTLGIPEEVIDVILDDVELDEEAQKEVKKSIQIKINTKAIRRDGWLDDVDNKR